jgi:hypothetical protein
VAEAAKELKGNEGIGRTTDVRFGLRLRRP